LGLLTTNPNHQPAKNRKGGSYQREIHRNPTNPTRAKNATWKYSHSSQMEILKHQGVGWVLLLWFLPPAKLQRGLDVVDDAITLPRIPGELWKGPRNTSYGQWPSYR
jgi:hypothetical protein